MHYEKRIQFINYYKVSSLKFVNLSNLINIYYTIYPRNKLVMFLQKKLIINFEGKVLPLKFTRNSYLKSRKKENETLTMFRQEKKFKNNFESLNTFKITPRNLKNKTNFSNIH